MIELFSDYVLHFERYFILSRQSMLVIQWCLTGLALLYVVSFHPKVSRRRLFFYAGIALRLILVGALSFELAHQMKAAEFSNLYIEEQDALLPFMQFLLFGYILLVSFHYMMTLAEKGGKGLFFAFDIAVMTMPFFQSLFGSAVYLKENGADLEQLLLVLVLLIGVPGLMICLFFQLYWKRNRYVLLLIFYIVTIGGFFIKKLGYEFFPLNVFLTMLGFLMTYHLLNGSRKPFLMVKRVLAAGTAVFFTLLLNPFYNLADAAFTISHPEVSDVVDANFQPVSVKEAKQTVSSFFPTDSLIYLSATNQDFHNVYHFKTKDYEAYVDGWTGVITNYYNQKEPSGNILSDQAYIKRSKQFLREHGRELDKQIKAKVSRDDDEATVEFYREGQDPELSTMGFTWRKETLIGFSEDTSVYNLESVKQARVSGQDIERGVEAVYRKLGIPVSAYQLTDIDLLFPSSLNSASINVKTSDGTEMAFHPVTGALTAITFTSESALPYRGQELEKRLLSLFDQDLSQLKRVELEKDLIEFQKKESDAVLNTSWTMTKHEEGAYLTVRKYFRKADEKPPYTYADGEKAFRKVSEHYQKGLVYYKRTKLVIVSDGDQKSRYAWLVIIQPFGSNEHDAYLVDALTNEVKQFDDK
ncbi:hypothetical protein ACWTIN_08845 [Bacillus paralicheniformis]|uniref:hypothetical protein n=1 Tax=Bacillus TaxID=1386 RepID=UPI0006531779|nr:hypothetical protein [Bacillus paralicheniformis]ARA85473.1 hypothetical protein BLMD_08375 [Bacillus paralicheniformis]KND08173.1 membrane protein [Bacillus paralicheniformis]KRT90565.1 hypothetical protein ACH97_218040 [Bacillus paralicheniformis]MBU8699808.1 hypothetical protein [Bacillus paralicheniformis]MCB6217455.1 hypothetical protein [Bacillus paralicheniformis]